MRLWWLSDFERLERERAEIEELSRREPWLRGVQWGVERGGILRVEANIEVATGLYPVRLRYPAFFPSIPPAMRPQDPNSERWSDHQYGSGGELCLEWGPDNWHPEVAGAELFRSAFRLLSAETVSAEDGGFEVPSRHRTTLGQDLRSAALRLILTDAAAHALHGAEGGAVAGLRVLVHSESIVAIVQWVESSRGRWTDQHVPQVLEQVDYQFKAVVVRSGAPVVGVRPTSFSELQRVVEASGQDPARLEATDEKGRHHLDAVLLVDDSGAAALLWIGREKGSVASYAGVRVPTEPPEARLGPGASVLGAKRVGVVGLGSAGSKVAQMLARSGVHRFLLVDDELFLPGNLVRHTLDWRSVGQHKVDGVAFQLQLVDSAIGVDVQRRQLHGQESSSSVAAALEKLSECDLIVDATACSRTFCLLGAVARQSETPLIWLEIFAGGIGGLVARYRPGSDPDPFVIRGKILSFFEEQEPPEVEPGGAYAGAVPDRGPLVASDADVTVISSHAARYALDVLAESEPSAFPHSAYLIGLARAWLFDAPFHARPIEVGKAAAKASGQASGSRPSAETIEFLRDVIERSGDGGNSSST